MASALEERKWLHRSWIATIGPLLFGAAAGAGMLLVALVVDHDDGAAGRLCDQAVAALLHSKDPVELQRAGIIIHELSCGISRRAEKGASEIVGLKHLWSAC